MKILLLLFLTFSFTADAQEYLSSPDQQFSYGNTSTAKRKLFQRNTGMIVGLQKGNSTLIELGGEAHWRKISLLKPHVIGATANMEYNFADHVLGYKAGLWMKRGRINLTYGANAGYFTNFKNGSRFGFGPSVGFRFFGIHMVNGYTFLTKETTSSDTKPEGPLVPVNTLYMSLRYYFPVQNKFSWDRQTMKKKKARKKQREKNKRQRQKQNVHKEPKSVLDIFKSSKKDAKK
ncbi:MAG: hypothetical protein ABIR81_06610 [Ginsengibacter sp.]